MLYGRLPTTRRLAAERREVEVERVADVQRERVRRNSARAGAPRGRGRSRSPSMRPARAISVAGQRAEPGPDLDDGVARLRRDRVDDARDVVRIGEEVLAEALARDVALDRARAGGRRRASPSGARELDREVDRREQAARVGGRARARRRPRGRARCRDRPTCATNGSPSVTLTPWPKLAALSTGSPWSWYIATIAS